MTEKLITTLLARQGIYTKEKEVYAYELLYRSGDHLVSNVNNNDTLAGDKATSSVLTQLFTNLDIDSIIGNKPAFINFTYDHLVEKIPTLLPKNRVVIEVLETVHIDNQLIATIKDLNQQGYKIALDDFIFKKETKELIEIADIIKIDVLHLDKKQIKECITPLNGYSGKLLAEKIEDKKQFQDCIDLGFDYFQGYFLNKPDPMKGQIITENKAHLIRLLAEINNEQVPLERIEEIILQIPKLSYQILRLTNSVALFVGKKIDTLMDAINQLGLIQIKNWLNLLLLSSNDDVVPDLIERTLIRAKMCESVSKKMDYDNPHLAYTVGVLSTLDGILNEPMGSLLSKIQLSDTLSNALLHKSGELGSILQCTLDYEEAKFNSVSKVPINDEELIRSYLQGIEYANSIIDILK